MSIYPTVVCPSLPSDGADICVEAVFLLSMVEECIKHPLCGFEKAVKIIKVKIKVRPGMQNGPARYHHRKKRM